MIYGLNLAQEDLDYIGEGEARYLRGFSNPLATAGMRFESLPTNILKFCFVS